MGVDYVFYAERSDESYQILLQSRANRAFMLPISYFRTMVPVHYYPDDKVHAYPGYRITKDAWDSWMRLILSQKKTISYLTGFVVSAFEFDEFIPDEFSSFEKMDEKILAKFRNWLYLTFPHERKTGLNQTEETESLITAAYMLENWFMMDRIVQEYMNMDDCSLWMRIE